MPYWCSSLNLIYRLFLRYVILINSFYSVFYICTYFLSFYSVYESVFDNILTTIFLYSISRDHNQPGYHQSARESLIDNQCRTSPIAIVLCAVTHCGLGLALERVELILMHDRALTLKYNIESK